MTHAIIPKVWANNHSPLTMAWRIRAVFDGKLPPKEYLTSDIRHNNPGWADEIFNRTIERLEFYLPTGHRIVLAGMEQYNFFVEAVQSTRSRNGAEIRAFWLCGKLPGEDIVEMWRVGNGNVIRDRKPWGMEWGGGPTRGWKPGVKGTPVSRLEGWDAGRLGGQKIKSLLAFQPPSITE